MKKYIILLVISLAISCKGKNEPKFSLGGFDISKDDKQILFTYWQNNVGAIYVVNTDGSGLKQILEPKNGFSFSNPKYSHDEKTFLFIESKNNDYGKSTIYICNIDGSNIKPIVTDSIITEAIFSKNSEEIFYCSAKTYNQNSPIGRANAHGFDIYSFNLSSNIKSKITNIKAYGINSIAEYNDGIVFHKDMGAEGGIFVSKNRNIINLNPLNNPRKDNSLYNNPIVFDNSRIAFTAPYELYIMDDHRIGKLIYRSEYKNILNLAKYHIHSKILFTVQGELNFYAINIENKSLEKIILDEIRK